MLRYLCNIFLSNWEEVDTVSHSLRCLHGGDVGIDQDRLNPLLFQCFDSLKKVSTNSNSAVEVRVQFNANPLDMFNEGLNLPPSNVKAGTQ